MKRRFTSEMDARIRTESLADLSCEWMIAYRVLLGRRTTLVRAEASGTPDALEVRVRGNGGATKRYTPEMEQQLIDGDIDALFIKWGISRDALRAKRRLLRLEAGLPPVGRPRGKYSVDVDDARRRSSGYHYHQPAPAPVRSIPDRFARPTWFVEDLTQMTKGAV